MILKIYIIPILNPTQTRHTPNSNFNQNLLTCSSESVFYDDVKIILKLQSNISDIYTIYLQTVSSSIPENPMALSPSIHTTRLPGYLSWQCMQAAIAEPGPIPIVPKVPASILELYKKAKCPTLLTCMLLERSIWIWLTAF